MKIRDNTSHDHRPAVRDTRLIEDFALLEDEDEHPAATKPAMLQVGYCRVRFLSYSGVLSEWGFVWIPCVRILGKFFIPPSSVSRTMPLPYREV